MFAQGILLLLDYTNIMGVRVQRLMRPYRLEVKPDPWHGNQPRLCLIAGDVGVGPGRDVWCHAIHTITPVPECPHCRGVCQTAGLDCACEAATAMVAEGCPHDA